MCFKGKDEYAEDSIFFPAVGSCYLSWFVGVGVAGLYSSNVSYDECYFYSMCTGKGGADVFWLLSFRAFGFPVRAVCVK